MNIIEFPGLWGLKLNVDPVAFQIGNITVYWYGIIIAIAFLSAVLLAMRQSSKFGIKSEDIIDLVLFAAPVAIIFARLYYVAFTFNEFKYDFAEVFRIWHGGLAIYGAIIGASIVGILFSKYKKIDTLKLFDLAAPYIVLAQAIGRWGNFVNQEAYGSNTSLPWGMTGNKIRYELTELGLNDIKFDAELPVHPTFLYESLWNLAVFIVLIWFRKKKKLDGEVFSMYLLLYGAGRFWIEGLRTDSLMLGSLRISQVLAAVFVVAFAALMIIRRVRTDRREQERVGVGESEYAAVLDKIKTADDLRENEAEAGAKAEAETEADKAENMEEKAEAEVVPDDNGAVKKPEKDGDGTA